MPNASGRRRRVSCCPAELPKGNEAVSPRIEDPSRRTFLAATGTAIAAGSAAGQDDPPLAPPDKQPPNLSVPDASPKTVGWAVAGPGQLALEEVLPAFGDCKLSKPVALVSGHPGKAAKVARRYGVDPKKVYDYQNYDRISEDPAVEAVYVILPNSMHAEFTIRAHKAGKHVLCEKPMAGSPAEAERMISAAKAARRKLMIAYRLRYEPFNEAAIDIRRKKELGVLKSITASNCQNVKPPNIRLSKKLAGGPVEDVGVYCVNAARYLTGEEPVEVSAVAHRPTDDPRFREVHQSVAFMLRFPSGVIANCNCSFGTGEDRRCAVQGADGVLAMENAFAYFGQKLSLSKDGGKSEVKLRPVNHFASEMERFSECILSGREPRTPGEDGLADMRLIAGIDEAARSGKTIKV
jgi:predicted dehydrogenase